MKQYTTPEQTAKLIELGFGKPKGLADAEPSSGKWVRPAYSIGELIEMLPAVIRKFGGCGLWILSDDSVWFVHYAPAFEGASPLYWTNHAELIDALFEMLVLLKEKGVI